MSSSSAAAAVVRAVSPIANSIQQTLFGDDYRSHNWTAIVAKQADRIARIAGLSSFEEVMAAIPQDYRQILETPLRAVQQQAEKLCNAKATLDKWVAHQVAKTLPNWAKSKAPEVQFTKEFSSQQEARDFASSRAAAHEQYLLKSFDDAVKAKKDEVTLLEDLLGHQKLQQLLVPIVDAQSKEIIASRRLPIFVEHEVQREDGQVVTESTLAGFGDNQHAQTLAVEMRLDIVAFAYRIRAIVEAIHRRQRVKEDKKKAVQAGADVEMADLTNPNKSPSVQSMIDKAVARTLKGKLGKLTEKQKKNNAKCDAKLAKQARKILSVAKDYTDKGGKRYLPPPSRKQPKNVLQAAQKDKNKKAGGSNNKGKGKARK